MTLLNFTIIKLTICLIIGILIGYYHVLPWTTLLYASGVLFLPLSIAFFISRRHMVKTIWFGLFAFLLMVSIGALTVAFHNEKNFRNHYTHYVCGDQNLPVTITFRVREILKPSTYNTRYFVEVLTMNDSPVCGTLLFNIKKDPNQDPLNVDDVLMVNASLQPIKPPLNPSQFDYKAFLEKKYIYHQVFTTNATLFKLSSKKHSLLGFAEAIRNHINTRLKTYPLKPDELAIINALLLGQRQDISETIYTSYTNAGAIHILAVSGLHVGILLLLLNFVLKPLEQFRHGRLAKTILLIVLLWSFALVAGLSASVTRAVTMFTILAMALNLKRPTNIFNTLAISIFVLLLIKPLMVFDVGFQLSYLAVFAISTIDPLLYKLWQPKYKIVDFYWHTLSVTLAAQVGILPLSLYYFHKIPGLFFLSNLAIVPILGFVLGMGLVVILLAFLNCLPVFVAQCYGALIGFITSVVNWVSQQKAFIIESVYFSLLYVFVFYALMLALINFWKQRHYKSLRLLLLCILMAQGALLFTKWDTAKNQLVIFHKNRHTLIGNVSRGTLDISFDGDSILNNDHLIANYMIGNHFTTFTQQALQPLYLLNDKKLLVVDSLGIYTIKSVHPDYVLLRSSPQINLNRLIDTIQPTCIIADGSNYLSYIAQWKSVCQKRKLPFHATGEKGAFIIE